MNLKLVGALLGAITTASTAANATPITETLDYTVVFGSAGTDTITGTVTYDPATGAGSDTVNVTGAVGAGTYLNSMEVLRIRSRWE